MTAAATATNRIAPTPDAPTPDPNVRHNVARMLQQSDAFCRMPAEAQAEIAHNTAMVADYLARPEGYKANEIGLAPPAEGLAFMATPSTGEASWDERKQAVDDISQAPFSAAAAREGAAVAGMLLNEVKFPAFVAGLIEGVFQSITKSSIDQMRAYQEMIGSVAKSLHQFMDDHVTPNQGRDNVVDQFPDLFSIGSDEESGEPRLALNDGVDEDAALARVNNKLEFQDGQLKSLDLSDANVESALVENSRIQLARQRQQLLASIVLMGINRIVVTDGKISAKIIYDVKSQDNYARRRTATAVEMARDRRGNVQMIRTESGAPGATDSYAAAPPETSGASEYSAAYFAQGDYKYEEKPVITAQTSASESSTAALQTKISLSGAVDVNFKSDYLPLDKMATPQMIATIQGNATPADPNVVPSVRPPPPASAAAPAPAAVAAPAVPPPAAGVIAPAPVSG
ncbi:MAG TPA: hypothetical protein VIT38_12835 [Allosphingosinicella sp.]